jgi:hypothetical protein
MESESSFRWDTLASYALLGGLAFAVYTRYQGTTQRRSTITSGAPSAQPKQHADLAADVASAPAALKKKAEKAVKPKPKPKSAATGKPTAASATFDPDVEAAAKRDEARANQDFAQSFSKMKSGHQFSAATKSEKKKQKSVKQSRAQEIDAPAAPVSAPSSTTGDADDDLSPAVSPVVAAADNSGVSDMLEAPKSGPSVLRLTPSENPQEPKQKTQKAAAPVETKKQRQNRKKAEQKKLDREQDEVERKKLEEKQRRTARLAEGRPAKDGSAFMANVQNAWDAKTNSQSEHLAVQPLDTHEPKPAAAKPAASGTKGRSDSWLSTLPSEEEQMAQVMEDSSAWSEVTSKKTKKGKKADVDTPTNPTPTAAAPAAAAPVKAPLNGSSKAKPALSSGSSFAALTPEETDEVEEEWEV